MGCDGGSIPKRHELVKTKKKEERADQSSQTIAAWFFCALSKAPLRSPVVSCALGKLYNREAILEFLLNKRAYGDGDQICGHIGSIKEVVTLNLTPNPSYSSDKDAALTTTSSAILQSTVEQQVVSPFICPITMKEMNGKYRFCYIGSCGCVLSEQALKEVPTTTCLKCNKAFSTEDVVTLNPTKPEDVSKLEARMERIKTEIAAAEAEKKAKKKEKKAQKAAASGAVDGIAGDEGKSKKKRKKDADDSESTSAAKRAATSSSSSTSNARANINMSLPKLDDETLLGKQSEAIKSLYGDKSKKEKKPANFLCMGTFNRYAAY
ncbi:hypothetical protein HK102_005188 [Quaeritorhiza haematococci]|nr:hypothetical protein HK102_005188 [Quaeritorhiza haematococci]